MKYKTFYNQEKLNSWINKNKNKYDYYVIFSQENDGSPTYIVEYKKLRSVY
jgi:hypothetical protein